MTMNPLPPQAYTKETLVQAYAWLQHQSDSIKEMATTPDTLVALYLKAKLQGDNFFERPSIQNFKNELKNLAGMMGEFEVLEAGETPAGTTAVSSATSDATAPLSTTQSFRFRSQDFKNPTAPTAAVSALPLTSSSDLDQRSLAMIQEVKSQFNLSSDSEALRLLVATGFHQLKKLTK